MLSREQIENDKALQKKRYRRERLIMVLISIVLVVLTFLEIRFSHFGDKLSLLNSFVFFGFKNLSIILVLLLLFLVARNIMTTYLERKKTVPGSRLRSKLVIVFLGFTVIPTIVLFIVSVFFIESSFERWFSLRIERSFKESIEVANHYYRDTESMVMKSASKLKRFVVKERLFRKNKKYFLKRSLNNHLRDENIDAVELITKTRPKLMYASKDYYKVIGPFGDYSREAFAGKEYTLVEHLGGGDIIRGIVPIKNRHGTVYAVVAITKFVPLRLAKKLKEIRNYYDDFKSIKPMKVPLKSNYLIILILMTLMIIFGATWFGIYLSRQITTPIADLVEGTDEIAMGNFDIHIEHEANDEIGRLVTSFNKMALDIKTARNKLDRAYGSLKGSNQQLREKQEYLEIVLRNVSTGVIALNRKGQISTVNDHARKLLAFEGDEVIGRSYLDLIKEMHLEKEVIEISNEMRKKGLRVIEKNLVGKFKDRELHLRLNISLLTDTDRGYLGIIVVFDDLSELQKTSRLEAWREVARRIAHEIKNPLTPIQLSAQRLNKKYIDRFDSEDREIFSDCTSMIIGQVDDIKKMVNEFASFARMPACTPRRVSLDDIIKEVLQIYKQNSNRVHIDYHNFARVDELLLDRDQLKRVFINLLDNSIAALNDTKDAEVRIVVSNNKILELVSIEVVDNGPGISSAAMHRLFEPYFSTKGSGGTGLGLTIVKQIISDHSGYIRASSSEAGAKFLIELPYFQVGEFDSKNQMNDRGAEV